MQGCLSKVSRPAIADICPGIPAGYSLLTHDELEPMDRPVFPDLTLRPTIPADLPAFFAQQLEPEALHMAAFASPVPDMEAFSARWEQRLQDAQNPICTILYRGEIAGYVLSYYNAEDERTEVAYWLGKEYWGRGIATLALRAFIEAEYPGQTLYARAAKDNIASLLVLEKCGFTVVGESRGFAPARGRETEEYVLVRAVS